MTTGGFKAFEYNWTTTGTSSTVSVIESRVKELLKGITQGIVQTNPHWGYDSNFTATADDYIKISSDTSIQGQAYAQFLVNAVTGSKMLVYYNPAKQLLVDVSCLAETNTLTDSSKYRYRGGGGLCVSIIPGGLNETWNVSSDCTTSEFIPAHGTKIIGTACAQFNTASSSSNNPTYIISGQAGRYVILLKDDVVVVMNQNLNSGNIYGLYATGKIFGTLSNAEDNFAYSKYGSIAFFAGVHDRTEINTKGGANLNVRTGGIFKPDSASANYFYGTFAAQHFGAINNGETIRQPLLWATDNNVYAGGLNDSSESNKTSFSAIGVGKRIDVTSPTPVVTGSGYKGYIDTDLFRNVYSGFLYNTLFDDGNFIYVGGGLAMGWDASNEVIFRT